MSNRTHCAAAAIGFLSTLLATAVVGAAAADKPPAVGDQAKDFELTALSGDSVKLSKMIEKGPVVLVVLRGYPGYQCPYCTRQFGDFLGKADAFKKAGAKVLFIYPGPADELKKHATDFVQGKDYPADFHMLLDPDYTFTNAYGLRWDAEHETAHPATFVIDKTGKITYEKISDDHGHRARAAEVLKALANQ